MVYGHSFVLVPRGRPNSYNKWKQGKPNKTETKQQEEDCKNVEATTICLGFLIKATGFLPISKICYV